MTALVYFFVAVLAAALSTRAWLGDRDEPTRQAFLGVGWFVALAYLSFALSLLPGLGGLRLVYMAAGMCVPAFTLWTIDRVFAHQRGGSSKLVGQVFAATAVAVPLLVGVQAVVYGDVTGPSVSGVLAGLFTFVGFAAGLYRLWEAHDAAELRVDRVRLRYLMGMSAGAVVFTLVEQMGRAFTAPIDTSTLSLASRGVVLQGAVPPVSTLFTGVALYFLYHTLVLSRLLDMHELFSRMTTLVASALMLVVVDAVTVVWFGTFTDHPLHSTFQVFLGSVLFLAAYEPLKDQLSWWSNRIFNQRGQQLTEVLVGLRSRLPTVISTGALTDTMMSRLHASGRVPVCSVYLWDPNLDAFACVGHRGFGDERPLAQVAAHPFTDALVDGEEPWYFRSTLARRARAEPKWKEILATMDAMKADLTMPFVSRGLVLGWLQVRDEGWSDGFSKDEVERFADVADLAAIVLSNISDFQALEEEHRLAALGAMAAGLAHEIRNPLAGIKGAAQYLQSERLPPDAQEMLNVVIDEADRLNVVVSQFLDYARPFELSPQPDHVNALVTHVLALLRAQGIPKSVTVLEDLAGDLPPLPIDRVRVSQVLLNLLQNALQAMPDGGTLTVATRKRLNRAGQPALEVVVQDTGVGIKADDLQKLFVPFFTTKPNGTGLGLAICQRIIQAHHGEIDVQSSPGRGATFTVRLPLPHEPEATEEEASLPVAATRTATAS